MTQDSDPLLTLKAEQSFTEKARNRFKVGKALEPEGKTRTNGFNQGPNYSIEVALSFMAVWTQLQEEEAKVKTGGFIDDSSVRTLRGDSEKTILEKIVKTVKPRVLHLCWDETQLQKDQGPSNRRRPGVTDSGSAEGRWHYLLQNCSPRWRANHKRAQELQERKGTTTSTEN